MTCEANKTHVNAPSRQGGGVQLFRVLDLERLRLFQGTLSKRHREVIRRVPHEVDARSLARPNNDLRRFIFREERTRRSTDVQKAAREGRAEGQPNGSSHRDTARLSSCLAFCSCLYFLLEDATTATLHRDARGTLGCVCVRMTDCTCSAYILRFGSFVFLVSTPLRDRHTTWKQN